MINKLFKITVAGIALALSATSISAMQTTGVAPDTPGTSRSKTRMISEPETPTADIYASQPEFSQPVTRWQIINQFIAKPAKGLVAVSAALTQVSAISMLHYARTGMSLVPDAFYRTDSVITTGINTTVLANAVYRRLRHGKDTSPSLKKTLCEKSPLYVIAFISLVLGQMTSAGQLWDWSVENDPEANLTPDLLYAIDSALSTALYCYAIMEIAYEKCLQTERGKALAARGRALKNRFKSCCWWGTKLPTPEIEMNDIQVIESKVESKNEEKKAELTPEPVTEGATLSEGALKAAGIFATV